MKRVDVSLERAEARVEFDDVAMSPERLVQTISLLGFRARLKTIENRG